MPLIYFVGAEGKHARYGYDEPHLLTSFGIILLLYFIPPLSSSPPLSTAYGHLIFMLLMTPCTAEPPGYLPDPEHETEKKGVERKEVDKTKSR